MNISSLNIKRHSTIFGVDWLKLSSGKLIVFYSILNVTIMIYIKHYSDECYIFEENGYSVKWKEKWNKMNYQEKTYFWSDFIVFLTLSWNQDMFKKITIEWNVSVFINAIKTLKPLLGRNTFVIITLTLQACSQFTKLESVLTNDIKASNAICAKTVEEFTSNRR